MNSCGAAAGPIVPYAPFSIAASVAAVAAAIWVGAVASRGPRLPVTSKVGIAPGMSET